jgi:hypothetical protein
VVLAVLEVSLSFDNAIINAVYLEHGAHWAIGALAVIMLLSIEPRFQVPEAVTASMGVVFIAAALSRSVLRNRRNASAPAQTG